ncbi:hypothetical protein [Spirillospora sp. NPDC029432]|uniref:hypothetical protein n=1 Tax=Spirillospora sp. NPDC029432 TaxID=3154599 RepID=UPI003454F68D
MVLMRVTVRSAAAAALAAAAAGTVLGGPAAAHAGDLDIEPPAGGGTVTVSGGCEAADREVRVTGAARGEGRVVDGWFTVEARIVRERAGEHRVEARCDASGLTQEGTFRLGGRTANDGNGAQDGVAPHAGDTASGGDAARDGDTAADGGPTRDGDAARDEGTARDGDSAREGNVARDEGAAAPVPRGWARTGGGGAREPGAPWTLAGTAMVVAAAGIGATALARSRAARGR